jgi:uncharacterized protein
MTAVPEGPVATEAALAALRRLEALHGPLLLMQSGGCCDGSSPVCLREGEFLLGAGDLRLGEVGGVPFYIDSELYRRWRTPTFELDVAEGAGDTFSLEGSQGIHFVTRNRRRDS